VRILVGLLGWGVGEEIDGGGLWDRLGCEAVDERPAAGSECGGA